MWDVARGIYRCCRLLSVICCVFGFVLFCFARYISHAIEFRFGNKTTYKHYTFHNLFVVLYAHRLGVIFFVDIWCMVFFCFFVVGRCKVPFVLFCLPCMLCGELVPNNHSESFWSLINLGGCAKEKECEKSRGPMEYMHLYKWLSYNFELFLSFIQQTIIYCLRRIESCTFVHGLVDPVHHTEYQINSSNECAHNYTYIGKFINPFKCFHQ